MEVSLKEFVEKKRCPACYLSKLKSKIVGTISVWGFSLFGKELSLPGKIEIPIRKCSYCGLYFKELIPSKNLIKKTLSEAKEKMWGYEEYDYSFEKEIINSLNLPPHAAIIDIGAYKGYLLKALEPFFKLRSALDILYFPETKQIINGEYIISFIENRLTPRYSYDVVGMFDVFEHCYDIKKAFQNCRKLLKPKGFLILETGDAFAPTALKYGIENWWYINFFEHHLVADSQSIIKILEENGFRSIKIIKKKHKSIKRGNLTIQDKIKNLFKKGLYKILGPSKYRKLGKAIRKREVSLVRFSEKDHMLVIAQKE